MGGSSSSNSEKTSKDQKVGASDSAVAAGAKGRITITDEFPEGVGDAINKALEAGDNVSERSTELLKSVGAGLFEVTGQAIDTAGQSAAQAQQAVAEVAQRQKEDETGAQLEDALPFLGIGAGVVIVFLFVRGLT